MLIWHLPFVRAIAAVSAGPPADVPGAVDERRAGIARGRAERRRDVYLAHAGSELRRGLNLLMLIVKLRRRRFRQISILDRTMRPAVRHARRYPLRIGLGLGRQQPYITNPGIDQSHFHDQPIDWLIALMAAMNVPLPTTEPALPVPAATFAKIGEMYASHLRPWIVLGIGASHPDKDWSDMRWLEFLASLRRRFDGTVFLIGGPQNHGRARA